MFTPSCFSYVFQELINTGIMTLLYFVAFIVQLATWAPLNWYYRGNNIAAGVS